MKKALLAITVVSLFIMSCGNKINSPIVGKWKLDKITAAQITTTGSGDTSAMGQMGDTLAKVGADIANAFSSLGTGLADAFLTGSIYEFKGNGTVTQSVLFTDTDGKFTVTPDGKSVTMTMDGKDEVYTITKVDDKNLVLTTKDNMDWNFTKE